MRIKGAIITLAITLTVACLYQLSFTWVTNRVEKKAIEISKGDPAKEKHYLDSISNEVVYNFLFLKKYTYKECKEREINLGLDLRGGMNVTLEISEADIIRALANHSTDSTFNKALALATEMKLKSQDNFVNLFGKAFEQIDPHGRLAVIFGTIELKEKINPKSTNKEVLNVIQQEIDDAIENSFNILRSRIDKFGVVQPNIQKLETKGRILVELPGIKDPERVRNLLQGTANLEFYETYENTEVFNQLVEANKIIAATLETKGAKIAVTDTAKAVNTNEAVAQAKPDSANKKLEALSAKFSKPDSTKKDTLAPKSNQNPLFELLQPNVDERGMPLERSLIGWAAVKDTPTINRYLALKQVRMLFNNNTRFFWSNKPSKFKVKQGGRTIERFELHAIKTGKNGQPALSGSVITSAYPDYGQNKSNPEVNMTMNAEGARDWARITRDNKGRCIAVVMDQMVFTSPRVSGEIPGGTSQITGMENYEEAKALAVVLKSGRMPAPARIVQDAVVGPSLGKEAINASMKSFIFAFIGVLLYMWLYYSRAGNVANVALFTNVFFLFGVFASMGLVLTLPGMAGVVLTLAMAVDGNVIIYERMREEVRAGKGEQLVVKDGFWHAYSAIIDGHVTTILTGLVLFLFGKGPVQGFATSLIVGLLLSLFSSIFIARLMFEWMLKRKIHITLGNKHTINAMTKANVNFIGLRKIGYAFSGTLILIGVISLFLRGLDPSVEFTGGRTYIVRFENNVTTTEVRESLSKSFGIAPEVKTFGADNQVKITTNYLINDKSHKSDSLVNVKLYEGLKPFLGSVSYEDFSKQSETKKVGELRSEKVDPVISNELIYKSFMAVFFGLIIIFIYIAIRFKNWKYGLGGVISLAHDTLVVVGMFSLFWGHLPFSLEIDQSFIAALLTIIGYSIMDTVIIYDRIREYRSLHPSWSLADNINSAINHTLGRTINTSGITFVVLVIMFIFGGEILRGFIFALLIGVVIGTYSSVFNATPVAYDIIRLTEKKKIKK